MTEIAEGPRRVEVWESMAAHFLDTETRQDIPLTALCCVQARLTTAEARDVWCYEVSPAVGFNVRDPAGEWGCWDREWLIERIERLRKRWNNRPGTGRWLRYRARVHFLHRVWVSIGRCLDVLLSIPADERERQARDLTFLARHYFDFCPRGIETLGAADRRRVSALYPEPLQDILAPAVFLEEKRAADERVRAALSRGTP